jgi:hypothetical protein
MGVTLGGYNLPVPQIARLAVPGADPRGAPFIFAHAAAAFLRAHHLVGRRRALAAAGAHLLHVDVVAGAVHVALRHLGLALFTIHVILQSKHGPIDDSQYGPCS